MLHVNVIHRTHCIFVCAPEPAYEVIINLPGRCDSYQAFHTVALRIFPIITVR